MELLNNYKWWSGDRETQPAVWPHWAEVAGDSGRIKVEEVRDFLARLAFRFQRFHLLAQIGGYEPSLHDAAS